MLQKQICVFVENKKGRLAEVTRTLGNNNINMSALSIADTTDFGILRMIVDKTDEAEKILKEHGFTVSVSDVIAISVLDKPGGLADVLDVLDNMDINIEYVYAFFRKNSDKAAVIIKVDKPQEAAEKIMSSPIRALLSDDGL